MPTEESPHDEQLELIRDAARAHVARFSLRAVAREVGISHTGLRDFVSTENPRTPYGPTRARLYSWAIRMGLPVRSDRVREGSGLAYSGAVPATIPPKAYELIYERTQRMRKAKVPEEQIDEARRLMTGETFNTRNERRAGPRDEAGWIKDVEMAWALIAEFLHDQGFDV